MFGVKNEFKTAEHAADYYAGLADGVRLFAWWRDGTQLVGTTGTTLAEALDQIDAERQRCITAIVEVAPEDQATPSAVANGVNPEYAPDDDGVSLREMAHVILNPEETYPQHYHQHVAGAFLNAIGDVDAEPLGEPGARAREYHKDHGNSGAKEEKPKKEKKAK